MNVWIVRILSIISVLFLWHGLALRISPLFLPSPLELLYEGWGIVQEVVFWNALASTLWEFVVALFFAIFLGIVFGALSGMHKLADKTVGTLMRLMYSTPRIAFIPLLVLWVGIGPAAKILMGISLGLFPVFFATTSALQTRSKQYEEVIRSFGGTVFATARYATIPAILLEVLLGLRLTAGLTLIGVVLGEMFTALDGVGGLLVVAAHSFLTARVMVLVLVLGCIGLSVIDGMHFLLHALLPWLRRRAAPM